MATTITGTGLTAPKSLSTIPQTPDPILTSGQGIIDNAAESIAGLQKTVDTSTTSNAQSVGSLKTLMDSLLGKAADTASLNETSGLNTERANFDRYNQELNDINANVSGLAKEARAIPLKIQNQFAGTGATDTGVAPIQAQQLRENAIKALTQSALADIATANINNSKIRYDAAKDKVQQAIDLKYQPIEQEIANLTKQLELNQRYITEPAEKKLAEAQKQTLDERARVLNEKKLDEKQANDIIIRAASEGTNPTLISRANEMLKAGASPAEIAQVLGVSPMTSLDMQAKIQSIAASKASVAKIYADIATENLKNPKNFVTPPLINPQTGKPDPSAHLAASIAGSGLKDNVQLTNIIGVISSAQGFAESNMEGKIKGLSVLPRLTPGFLKSQEKVSNKSAISAMNLRIQQWASGAALDADQKKFVNKVTPKVNDSDNEVRKKINALTDFMLTQAQSEFVSQGINYQPPKVDYFKNLSDMDNNSFLSTIPTTTTNVDNNTFFNK